MTGVEVVGCIAAVVSAFHGAAELIEILKVRKEKKKKRRERDIEQIVQEKLLHTSLLQGERECESRRQEGSQRFGRAFDRGDDIAVSQLKDVVIHLQGEVIRALQIAMQCEAAVLDVPRLHDASIMDRTNALRSMSDLSQRILMRLPPPRELAVVGRTAYGVEAMQRPSSVASAETYHTANMVLPAAVSIPGRPTTVQQQHLPSRMQSTASTTPSFAWILPQIRSSENEAMTLSGFSVHEVAEDPMTDHFRRVSLHDSARSDNDADSDHRVSASTGSTSMKEAEAPSLDIRERPDIMASVSGAGSLASALTPTSSAASTRSSRVQDTDDEIMRSASAPEVVTKEYGPMLSPVSPTFRHPQVLLPPTSSHPAYRDTYYDPPAMLTPEPEQLWSPLERPTKLNDYHNFCRGAWATRSLVQEGLSITLIPDANNEFQIPHWKCKHCQFRWRSNSSAHDHPDYVLFHKGIRYRWLFLAKSHVVANEWHSKIENYQYGCIICTAQGHGTSIYENREALLNHILSKHKTISLTPAVKDKVKCVVGGTPKKEDTSWDINIPESRSRSFAGKAEEHFVAAVTGISNYGQ
jgi:hypothetical protein